jgi:phosphatidylglycerol:prolipoprotein diacylglycerol transferase
MITLFPSRPVAIEVFGFGIHWYGLLYLCSFLVAWWLLPRLQARRGLTLSAEAWSNLLSAAVLGVVVGGRLGYVLFYEPTLLRTPLAVLAVWHGGMSFHGGLLGVVIALLVSWWGRSWFDLLRLADVVVVPVAIGLALGRLGNFINQELYGPVTTLPWAVAIPGVEGLRHPTPLYACLKDLLIAASCFVALRQSRAVGVPFGLFLCLYGVLRFSIEWLRVQSVPPTLVAGVALTRGQLLTIPVFVAGCLVLLWAWRRVAR